jgi:hypothetical protein
VKAVTAGGHTALHLAADVGNHVLCGALVEHGADPNAQSQDGYTAYGYVCRRQAAATGASLQVARMLQQTAEQLLKSGAYKVEKSETFIDQDTDDALWMKGREGLHQLRCATAPRVAEFLTRPSTDALDVDSWCWQFHRTLGGPGKDPFHALGTLLQLLREVYEQAPTGSAAASFAVHIGVWRVLDRVFELRPELFPDAADPATAAAAAAVGSPKNDDDEAARALYAASIGQRDFARRSLRDLVATTVRSGLPEAFGLTATSKNPLKLPAVLRYAKQAAAAGDPIWGAFLSRSPLAAADPPARRDSSLAASTLHGTYRTLASVVAGAFGRNESTPAILRSALSPVEREKGILAFTAQQLAAHLTMLTHMLFSRVQFSEYLDGNFGHRSTSPNYHLLKEFVNRIEYVLTSEIIRHPALKERAAAMALLVRTAEVCLTMNNYDTPVILVAVLGNNAVHRLQKSWNAVSCKPECSMLLGA